MFLKNTPCNKTQKYNQPNKKYSSLLAFSVVRLPLYHDRCRTDYLWKRNTHFYMYLSTEVGWKSVWMFVSKKKILFLYIEKIPLTKRVFLNHKGTNDSKVRRTNKCNEQHKPEIWTTAVKANSKKMKLSDWV